MKKTILVLCSVILLVGSVFACTSLRIKTTDGYVFYARTMEGEVSPVSAVSIIPAGTKYQGTLPDGASEGLKWTTKYGFVGMNAEGMPLLSDGMNEKGLVAGNLLFPGFAGYQTFEKSKADITIAQYEVLTWILSNFATVNEAREGIKKVRVCKGPEALTGPLPLHYVIHDPKGNCLVVEYVKGELKVYDNPIGVMTNSPAFDWHLINLCNFINLSAVNIPDIKFKGMTIDGLGQGTGMLGLPGDYTPPSRFIRMVALTQSAQPVTGPVDGLNLAMTIINNIEIPVGAVIDKEGNKTLYDRTWWVTIGDTGRLRYYFHTYTNKNWQYVDLMKALKDAKAVRIIKLDIPTEYKDITDQAN